MWNDFQEAQFRTSLIDKVLTITLDEPSTRNALDVRGARILTDLCRRAALDADVGAVVVTGVGGFCSGGNFKAFGARDPGDPLDDLVDQSRWNELELKAMRFEAGAESSRLLHEMPKPTIALVTGAAVGAGVGLAAACDFRVLSPGATFRPGYLHVGLSPDFGTSYYITQILGSAKARAFFLLADVVNAQEAWDLGLATELGDSDQDALQRATRIATRLAQAAPIAVQYTKSSINRAEAEDLRDVLAFEAQCFARCFQSSDQKEAVTAILQKRLPSFKGR